MSENKVSHRIKLLQHRLNTVTDVQKEMIKNVLEDAKQEFSTLSGNIKFIDTDGEMILDEGPFVCYSDDRIIYFDIEDYAFKDYETNNRIKLDDLLDENLFYEIYVAIHGYSNYMNRYEKYLLERINTKENEIVQIDSTKLPNYEDS